MASASPSEACMPMASSLPCGALRIAPPSRGDANRRTDSTRIAGHPGQVVYDTSRAASIAGLAVCAASWNDGRVQHAVYGLTNGFATRDSLLMGLKSLRARGR